MLCVQEEVSECSAINPLQIHANVESSCSAGREKNARARPLS